MEKNTTTSNGVDPIQREEHKPAHHEAVHHEHHPIEHPDASNSEPRKLKEIAKKVYERFSSFTYLEMVGTVAIMILVLNMFFEINVTVAKKPLLQKMLGSKAGPQVLPPQLANNSSQTAAAPQQQAAPADSALLAQVLPSAGVELPVTWGDLGKQMVSSGVIDQQKFENV